MWHKPTEVVILAKVTNDKKQTLTDVFIEFLKAQVAGNVLFFGTMLGFFIGDKLLHAPEIPTLIVSSILANIIFFLINRELVFTSNGQQRSTSEVYRFILLMTFNMLIYTVLTSAIAGGLAMAFSDGPIEEHRFYAAQVLSAMIFSVWTYIGLKFWVFAPAKSHATASRHTALTVEKRKSRRT